MTEHADKAFDLMSRPTLMEFFARLFTPDFMPHGHCFFWRPEILWLHVTSDFMIGLAYYLIPFALFQFVRKRRDLVFNWMFVLFAVFILACGTTHFMNIWTMWHGTYRLDGLIKLFTAAASLATAVLLYPLIPKALLLRSPAQLEQEVQARTEELRKANELLAATTAKIEEFNSELIQSNKELEQFAYVASHDLQEPLRSVSVYADMVRTKAYDKLNEEEQRFLTFAIDEALRSQELIKDLLEFARVGASEKKFKRVDMEDVLDITRARMRIAIMEAKAQIEAGPLPEIFGDENEMAQVLQNLISNSLKYQSQDPPRIVITAVQNGAEWVFSVKDNGIGISPDSYEKIFGLFQRLHPKGRYPGTGIGLAICKKIIERHKGKIWVTSEPGKGSIFYFTVPAFILRKGTE